MENTQTEKVRKFYILVRTDMETMTPGRIAAQCAHASTILEYDYAWSGFDSKLRKAHDNWTDGSGGVFGTVIVLDGKSEHNLLLWDGILNGLENHYYSFPVFDPEYPIRDGNSVHLIPDVLTCLGVMYIGDDLDEDDALEDFKLL